MDVAEDDSLIKSEDGFGAIEASQEYTPASMEWLKGEMVIVD